VIAEGLFTQDEVTAAKQYGAEVSRQRGRIILTFPNNKAHEKWEQEQKQLHPNHKLDAIKIPTRDR
jgi:hypothetical protein